MVRLLCFAMVLGMNVAFAGEKPTWRADLSEFTADGSPIIHIMAVYHQLTLNESNGRVVSFDLLEKQVSSVTTHFKVSTRADIGCGSKMFIAEGKRGSVLRVVDHRKRFCDDLKPAVWEVQVSTSPKAKRYFRGNPTALSSYSSCQPGNDFMFACIMLYAPVQCTVDSYEGKELTPPIKVQGGNSCFANLEIKSAMCARGLDPDRLKDEDVSCSPVIETPVEVPPICPMPMCAAPPEGCRMKPSAELNEGGCPKYPCGIMVCDLGM